MYDNWSFITLFLFPLKKKREEEKENEVVKPVLNIFFQDPINFHLSVTIVIIIDAIILPLLFAIEFKSEKIYCCNSWKTDKKETMNQSKKILSRQF